MNDLEKRIANLPPEKRELLLRRLEEQKVKQQAARPAAPALPARDPSVPAPLSFAQQRLWFLERLQPGTALYNNPTAFRVRGPLDVAALEYSLARLIQRHESLRTVFIEREGEAFQVIQPTAAVELKQEDLRGLPEAESEAEALRRTEEEVQRPFELERGPLLRVGLLRLGEQEYLMLLTMHHIVSDGWSMEVLVRETVAFYQSRVTGTPVSLPPLPAQYADFAAWQRQWLTGDVLRTQLDYWKKQLAGSLPVLELPTDRPRPATLSPRGATHAFPLSAPVKQALDALCAREGVTPFMALLAVFKLLLSRYSSQEDLVVGTPIAGRNRRETEGLIGFFINTLVMRTDLSGNPSFRELLGRVREVCLGAYAHQELPFETLVEALQPERHLSRTPLFQVMFNLQNMARTQQAQGLAGLTLAPVELHSGTSMFDLSLSLAPQGEGLSGLFEYSLELFDAATIHRMAGHFQTLVEALVADPRRRVLDVPLMDERERHRVLLEWSNNAARSEPDACLHQLFEAQVARTPEAVALVLGSQSLTYGELDARANQLARHLRVLGVGPDVRVALCVERSLEMVVGVLGVLKAGGAYVPLDPSLPRERLALILQDSAAPVLLTQRRLTDALPPGSGAHTVLLDADWEEVAQESAEPLPSASGPGHLAYVIYTSGSTGRPKGVLIEHRAVCNLVRKEIPLYGLGPGGRMLQFANFSFDISVEEIFTTLTSGATLHLAHAQESGRPLQELLQTSDITVVSLTPAVLAVTPSDALPSLRTVISGGEACPAEVVARWGEGRRFLNTYGPTEGTVVATASECVADGQPPPIGRPLEHVEAYVLDSRLNPVPSGVRGELYLGGAGLARGYLNQAGLTAERFVPHPFARESGQRLYRTGDVVRFRADGQLEFLGRADEQVKVRGFRIEPGEVEALLRRQPEVHEASVIAREDVPGDKRLVAYVSPAAGRVLDPSKLRRALRDELPEYMVPSAFVVLDALPLTPNGKVDRKALPAPAREGARTREYVAPRTDVQRQLAAMWSELLHVERVGLHDDFFELGGHSLLTTQVVSRIRKVFQVELPLRELFDAPTVGALAARVERAVATGQGVHLPPLERTSREERLALSFAQQRMLFLDQLEPDSPLYNIPSVVTLAGPLDARALELALREVQRRHESLRTVFLVDAQGPSQRMTDEHPISLTVEDLRHLPEDERQAEASRRATEEVRRPFVLDRGPLVRALLVRLEEERHVLALTMHHIVSDGWSMGVLVRELVALHEAFRAGQPSPLPELPVQYADFAAWQRQWLRGSALQTQLDWWNQRLGGMNQILELPTDRPRPPTQSFRGAAIPVRMPRELARAVRDLSQREGVTPFMLLLAAFQVLLHRYSGQEDFGVGTPIAGRNRAEVEGLIGFFVNTLVLRARLGGDPTFRELLAQVRETTLGAYAHQDLPFERLVEALKPERDLSRSPLFQVLFVHEQDDAKGLSLKGLTLSPVEVEQRTSKFDLTLTLADTADGLNGMIEYSTELFDETTVRRMAGHLHHLLRGIVEEPARPLSRLPLLSEEERRQQLVEWNATHLPREAALTLHGLIEAQVERTPDAVAVEYEDQTLTYRELDTRAGQLANALRARGVGPESRVVLCVERSVEMVVGLLGVLKAGGAYVPLEPTLPRERLRAMVQGCEARVVLTQAHLVPVFPEAGPEVLCLDTGWAELARSEARVPAPVKGSNLAYVIFTSGSTGQPKGAMNTHEAICNRLLWMQEAYGLTAGDRVLQKTPYGFDVSVWEFFWPLMTGARLVVARPGGHQDSAYLAGLIAERGITTLHFVPSMLGVFLEEQGLEKCTALKRVICSGEALPAELAARCLELLGAELHNLYGPTEAAVDVTAWACVRGDRRASVPIGRPIANVYLRVLDARLGLVPVGAVGELYLGGIALARGYVGRPDLTAERFVPDPFGEVPGARLYKTGDLVRYLADGAVEYLGRTDFQVKIRGLRIELGEIEAVLVRQPSVRQCVVVAREDTPGHKRLVAYVVPAPEWTLDVEALRAELKARLPEYMVPSAFVSLEALPLSSNGKLERRALPAPDAAVSENTFVAPSTPVERALAAVWAEVLGVPRVGLHDNFFALGGDSILSMRIISRARQVGLRLTPKQLFRHQTLAELAPVVSEGPGRQDEQGIVSGPVPLTPIQRWWLEQETPEPHHFNQSLLLEARERLDAAWLEQALRRVVLHHDALRLRLTRSGEDWSQHNAGADVPVELSRVDLSSVPEHELASALDTAAAELQRSLDLTHGPLLRVALFERGEGRTQRLLLVLHHLVVDAVSWRFVLEDLETAYRQLGRGEAVALPAKTTSFKTWAERLDVHARSEAMARELPYWRSEPRRHARPLPVDRQGENDLASARSLTVSLDAERTRALLQTVSSTPGARMDEVLLAALAQAVARWTGQPRLLVDLEGHGREELFEDVDLSRTVGWFTTLYPALLEADASGVPAMTLRRVRQSLRQMPGKGLGHGLLRYLRRDEASRRLQALPGAPVLFNYLGQLDTLASGTSLFSLADQEPSGASRSERGPRSHVLEINGGVFQGRLELAWTYSENLHERGTIDALASAFLETLTALAEAKPSEDDASLAELPLVELEPHVLERVTARVPEWKDLYPLSPVQEGMLFHARLSPGSGVYFEQLVWTFRGAMDMAVLRRAWEHLVERHAILRTSFLWEEVPQPLQVVRAKVALDWSELDVRGLSAEERTARMEALIREDRARGFELMLAPPTRMTVVRLEEQAWQCVWSYHHLLLDGWSVGLLFEELFAFYEALERGETPRRERTPAFREYIAWLLRQDLAEAESWWRETLAGFRAPTPLPESEPVESRAEGAPEVEERQLRLSAGTTTALRTFAREHHLTLNTLAQGTWALVLARHAGVDDVVFGTTVSGRPPTVPHVERMVGMFINTLPVRVRVPPHEQVLPWLRRLQVQQVEMRQFEHSPLVRVQGWSEVPRGTALFDNILVFENYPVDAEVKEQARRLEVDDVQLIDRTNYPLSACVMPHDELVLMLSYDTRRFGPGTIGALLGHWRTALEQLLESAERPLSELTLLSAAERQRMLVEWNDSRVDVPLDTCAHHLFEAQVERTPEATALQFEDTRLTYRELDTRANQLAHHLRQFGVGPETPIGLCVERSPEFVIGMLGVLKAGGAFLPLDPSHPPERIAFVLRDAAAPILLTQEAIADELPVQGQQLLCLDTDWDGIAVRPSHAPESFTGPEHLAYLIYTSGSTGLPKGTLLHHRGLCNTAQAAVVRHGFTAHSRVLQFASPSFDASVCEVFGALLAGACLVLAPRDALLPGAPLQSLLVRQSVSAVTLTPTVFAQLDPFQLPALTTLISAGEACPPALARAWSQGRRFLNAYGPTEVTVCASITPLDGPASAVSIGTPWPNTQLFVLDEALRPVPLGAPGELFVSGVGLARGYLGQPALTAERFLPHPFSTTPGARLYRTGDRARWLPDGSLQFLGRLDGQVKLRGIRIELGEIESCLREHPEVVDVCVLLREDLPGDKRLVAYVVAEAPLPESSALRALLERKLPTYMVPSAFVFLPGFPLTSAGKLNRTALPRPEQSFAEEAHVPPRTPTEELLASLWAELLAQERVGVTDDFFALGGHSLLAAQIISRVQAIFGVEISINELFASPTIEGLARKLTAPREGQPSAPPPVVPTEPVERLPLSLSQQAYWSPERGGPHSPLNSVPTAFWVEGALDTDTLSLALGELVRRHEILRTTFPLVDGEPVQHIGPPGHVPLALEDLTHLPEAEREVAALERLKQEAWRPFDVERGPLLRAHVLRVSDERHLLLLNLHHAITDLVGGQVLLRELAALHGAFGEGLPSPLPEPTLQYRDFTRWQHEWLRGETLERLRGWWRETLAGPVSVRPLPAAHVDPEAESPRSASLPFTLSPELWERLGALSRREGVTPFLLLLTAYQATLARFSGQGESLVAFAHAHRVRPELEALPGMFANLLVVRTRLADAPGFRELLHRVRASYLGAFAYQGLPHGELVRLLNPSVPAGRTPRLPAGFSFSSSPGETERPGLPGLTLSPVPLELDMAVSDISLVCAGGADGLSGSFEYKLDAFRRESVEALSRDFLELLERVGGGA